MSIHPSVVDKLDPEYVAFHNAYIKDHVVPAETLPWDPKIRERPSVPGTSEPLEVASIKDYDLSKARIRVFTPKGERPAGGWPVLIWFHGGGWTLGNISSDTSFATQMVNAANCVAVSVDYRLAPENKYPAAVEDAIEALDWVLSKGPTEININPSRISVGGSSSGGNIAAILSLKAAERNIPLMSQLLIVPVADNTASVDDLWAENQHTPWLTPARMNWFKNNYLPNKEDWTKWDASPTFAPVELLGQTPKAFIAVCEMDILKNEGIAYGEKLRMAGVEVETVIYPGAPHPIMAMDGVLEVGRKLVRDAGRALSQALSITP
ncbi:hypothetical protein AGABI1DRAFT_72317 [Agaricus bisporus var. burnettii JB137-S8]|uniref:Alpha/beta hydrolase fold-3 domain-containing protein n=1 Tax=Agaricus bisporus var. burnettii (strain JB137-S8 / ATCC MYA-4627 / FGSC 10392) TaxID=597362 RepID=K5XDY8_AGABU|nr:uncharacterized protein AGABI1DRAFT_72317 [Agaricus bisporus var. burnettii JB137-S8]EKM81392.1 hypothetical protein AGABI1DRAFT_72317 [Agaricus bisporus var. burnettii JB137-S8]